MRFLVFCLIFCTTSLAAQRQTGSKIPLRFKRFLAFSNDLRYLLPKESLPFQLCYDILSFSGGKTAHYPELLAVCTYFTCQQKPKRLCLNQGNRKVMRDIIDRKKQRLRDLKMLFRFGK